MRGQMPVFIVVLIDWLIDYVVFYAVSTKFHPYNNIYNRAKGSVLFCRGFGGWGSIISSRCVECPRLVEPPRNIRKGVMRIKSCPIWQKLRSYKVFFWVPSLCYVNAKCNLCILSIFKCFLNKTDIINISFLPNFSFKSLLFVLWREL